MIKIFIITSANQHIVKSNVALTTKLTDYSVIALFLIQFFLDAMVQKKRVTL